MICIIAVDIFAFIIAIDDAEIRRIAAAAVLNALTFNTDGTAGTRRSWVGSAFCAAIGIISSGIDAFDGIGRRSGTHIHIAS